MKITKTKRILAADDDLLDDEVVEDVVDELSDTVDDLQEQMDEIEEDEILIEEDINIAGHYIAQCDICQGIFISAVNTSDQVVTSITGICPLCDKESEQFLNWVIEDVER